MAERDVELLRRIYELINAIGRTGDEFVDPESIAPDLWARLAPDFEFHERPDLPDAKVYRSREESKDFWRKTQELFAEVRWEPREFIDLGEIVVVVASVIVVGRESDARYETDETDVFWFRDGQLSKLQAFPSKGEALAAAGAGRR